MSAVELDGTRHERGKKKIRFALLSLYSQKQNAKSVESIFFLYPLKKIKIILISVARACLCVPVLLDNGVVLYEQ